MHSIAFISTLFRGDFDPGVIIVSLVILVLLVFSAAISGSEIAYFFLGPAQLEEIESKKSKTNALVLSLLEMPKRLLATILISNNFTNVSIVILGAYVSNRLFDFAGFPILGFIIEVVVMTGVILLFGEIMPKIYATQKPVAFARFMAGPLRFLIKLFHPLSSIMVSTTSIIDKRFARKGRNITMDELSDAIDITADDKNSDKETKILKGIVKFTDIEVKEIMNPRMDVTALDAEIPFGEVIRTVIESGYSRIPVYEETFDNIKGILYVKDLLPHLDAKDDLNWLELLRPAFYVPENKKINDLLNEIQEKKIHLAIVVDEYGGTSGIVTLEDIIEEIVGEITDEFDVPGDEIDFKKIDDNKYVFEGKTSINDFCKIVEIEDDIFDDVKGDSDSLAGLILEAEGSLPKKNKIVPIKNFTFKILTVDSRRIKKIEVNIRKG
ncbi:MAG: gliding motility-associated protein GldE [Chlorobi bacterium]|nr:gliding motility-associated protein GldE [Chlorobiota bacterium]